MRHLEQLDRDKEGYLNQLSDWSLEIAAQIACEESIELTDKHWQILNYVRDFYHEYDSTPPIRILVKSLKLSHGPDIGNSIYLHKLFPKGPAKQACKIAGLPKPIKCI